MRGQYDDQDREAAYGGMVHWWSNGIVLGGFWATIVLLLFGKDIWPKIEYAHGKQISLLGSRHAWCINERVLLEHNWPELITGKVATPVADHLFNVRDKKEARVLEEKQVLAFHHTVAQLLFMATRARQDIQSVVVFLMTRVKNWTKMTGESWREYSSTSIELSTWN